MTPMPKRRKILFALISFAGIILCLLILLMIVTPHLINLEAVKEKIKRQYAADTGGDIEYQRVDIGLFPRPHIRISEVVLRLGTLSGTVDSVRVYPKILPLFTGDLQIGAVHSRSPKITIGLPLPSTGEQQPSMLFSFETLADQLPAVAASISKLTMPRMVIGIRNGSIHILRGNDRLLVLQGLNGQFKGRNDPVEFAAECQSNFWERIAIEGFYDQPGFKVKSRIQINQLRLHAVADYLFPQSDLKLTNARANLTVDLQTDGPRQIQAEAQGFIPYVHGRRGNTELKFDDISFQGGLKLNDQTTTLTLLQLDLQNPRLNLAGRLNIDPAQPGIQLDLEGRHIHIADASRIALALTKNDQTVSEIFAILRGGDVQKVTLEAQGSNWSELADARRFVIRGSLTGGEIFIPEVQLHLQEVQGDATIVNGILQAENAEARMGKSYGSKGKLAIALTGENAPFHIETRIRADLSQLPPVLTRVVENEDLKKELALLEKFEGTAEGMMVIGEDMQDLNVHVTASEIQLNAQYQRIPFPVIIRGGNLVLDGARIALTNIDATVGKSSLSQLSSQLRWSKTSLLELSSKSAAIDLAQLYGWLSTDRAFEARLRRIEALNGTVFLQNVNLNGPLLNPGQWRLQSKGVLQNLSLSSSLLPGNLNVAEGHFTSDGEQLQFQTLNAQAGKSSFSDLSASLKWGTVMNLSANARQSVFFLDEMIAWLQSRAALKPYSRHFQQVSGTLVFQNLAFNGPLAGKTDTPLSLGGAIQKWDILSPKFPTRIELAGGNLIWRGTRVELQETSARFGESGVSGLSFAKQWGEASSFEVKADSADIHIAELYAWLLSFEAPAKMFKGVNATQGKLTLGPLDFKAPGDRKAWQFQLTGGLQNLTLESDSFKAPIYVDSANFSAGDTPGDAGAYGRMNLNGTQLRWEDSRMLVQGQATFSADQLVLDMRLAADRLNWGQIDQVLDLGGKPGAASKMKLLGSLKVESDSFTYDRYAWQPMHAEISLNASDTRIVIKKAELCGIQFPGTLRISTDDLELYFTPAAENQNLEPSLACLSGKKNLADGSFNLKGQLTSKGKPTAFPGSLTGNLEFTANEGRIYRFGLFAKIFALLNVTEIYRGEVPDVTGKGFAYNSMKANGVFKDGKLVVEDTTIDSPSMGIAVEGEINLIKKKVNLVVLVAPFKTVDSIVKLIPLVGHILGGELISIPFRAVGDWDDPDVIPLSPTAVGEGLVGILKRTLKLPITIIQPVLPGSKEKKDKAPEPVNPK